MQGNIQIEKWAPCLVMETPTAPATLAPPPSAMSCLQTKPPFCDVSCVCKQLLQWPRLKATVCTLEQLEGIQIPLTRSSMHALYREGTMGDVGLTFQTEFPCSLGVDIWLLMFKVPLCCWIMLILKNKQEFCLQRSLPGECYRNADDNVTKPASPCFCS